MAAGRWDERYSVEGFAYGDQPNDWLRSHADRLLIGGKKILSLAEGEGRNAAFLASLGLAVTAVDQSAVGLAKARGLAEKRGVKFETVEADLTDFDLGVERWDGIVSIWCHLPSDLRMKLHTRLFRALKPGGWLILVAYAPSQVALGTGGPKDPDFLASEQQLKQELMGLEWYESHSARRVVSEGALHSGPSDVIQLVGRKAGGKDGDAYESFRCDCG